MRKILKTMLLAGCASACMPALAAPAMQPDAIAEAFGKREMVIDISLSPDGKHVALVVPGPGHTTAVMVTDADGKEPAKLIGRMNGDPLNFTSCGWTSASRLACQAFGISTTTGTHLPFTRTIALDMDGNHVTYLGRKVSLDALRISQFDGTIIDWRQGDDGAVLMTHDYVPEDSLSSGALASDKDGLAVDEVDSNTGRAHLVEQPNKQAVDYIADGQGNVRIMEVDEHAGDGTLTGTSTYYYRKAGSRHWERFSQWKRDNGAMVPIAVDGTRNLAYATKPLDGRDALYAVALDGTFKADLVSSNPTVDVHSVVTIGRRGRIIGASYITDRRQVDYFDPEYKKLGAALGRALPKQPLVHFVSASADESRLLIWAGSDVDAGSYYTYDKATRHLNELQLARPDLEGMPMAAMKMVTFKAGDGTEVPAYLSLPPSGAQKNLPAIVMPHGGPSYRDEWGFDWLVQYFANRGFAVIQPEFRGSSGYGDGWYSHNGFHSWPLAIGDVCDAGRWLVKQGIADPGKLAIVGWSYGGYAALQSNVLDPALFKAVVAVAPVTDLGMLKAEAAGFTNEALVAREVGSGETVSGGSPARHADKFKAPVLMFHGDRDLNVAVAESKAMDAALRRAGKQSTLVVFPGLDHQLEDSAVRANMLAQADTFLRTALKLDPPASVTASSR